MVPENIPNTSPNKSYGEEGVVSQEKKKKQIIIAGVNYEKEAMDAAEAKMTTTKEELSGPRLFRGEDRTSKEQIKGVGNVLKKVWKHNLFHEYYRQKELSKARRAIKDSGNLYVAEKGDQTDHNNAMQAIVDRFASEYEEDMIHSEAGEKKKILGNESIEEQELKVEIQDIIRKYAQGEIDENEFLERKDKLFNRDIPKIKGEGKGNLLEKSNLYASNILEIAREIKYSVEHGEGLDSLDEEFEIVIGKASVGTRTENDFGPVDKMIDKIQKSWPGRLLANEAVIASGVAITYGVLIKGSTSAAVRLGKFLGPLGLGVSASFGGAVAGVREGKRVQEERTQHSRDMAKGKSFEKNAERRTEMEKYRHETKGATELTENLEKSLELLDEKNGKSIKAVLAHLNEIEARISFSDQKNIDLIQYSDAKKIEQERMQLDLVRAKAKVELRKINGGNIKNVKEESVPLKEYLEGIKNARIDDFSKEQTTKDEAFDKFRRKKIAGAFVKGALIGAGVGVAVQEGVALFGGSSEGLLNTKEAFAGSGTPETHHFTALEYLRRYMMNDLPRMDVSQMHEEIIGNNAHLKLPVGVNFHENTDGSFDLLREGNPIAKGLTLDQDGHLTNASHQILKDENIFTSDSTQQISSESTKEIIHSPKEYIKNHENLFEKIKRGSWADNDTLKPDKNEFKLWWGGEKGTGIDSNGQYVFNIKHMLPEGSSHNGTQWNPEELMKEGKMKLLISLSEDSQNQVVEIPIDANGNAIIDPNSEIGKIAFENVNGHAKFLGRFAEIAVSDGQKDGVNVFNSLATYEGKGLADWKETIKVPGEEISTTILDIPAENAVDWPYAIPVLGRNPLERTKEATPWVVPGYYEEQSTGWVDPGYYEEKLKDKIYDEPYSNGPYDEDYFDSEKSSNHIENPKEHEQNIKNSLDIQKNYLDSTYGEDKNELIELASQTKPMSENCKLSINLPAYKEKNIYQTLQEYSTKQKNKDGEKLNPELFEINVLINRRNENVPFDTKTIKEVEKFQRENPKYHINIIKKTFDFGDKPVMGQIYKTMADLALYRNMERENDENKSRLILRTGGADAMDKNPNFLSKVMEKFNDPETAVYKSESRLPRDVIEKLPLLHVLYVLQSGLGRLWTKGKSNIGLGSFSAEVYAKAGGFNKKSKIAEEVDLAKRIRKEVDQSNGKYKIKKDLAINAIDDPKRYIWALYNDIGMANSYNKFGNKEIEESVRSIDWSKKVINEKIPAHLELTKENLEREINNYYIQYFNRSLRNNMPEKEKERALESINKVFSRMLFIAGFAKKDYEFVKNEKSIIPHISIKNISKLKKLIKNRKFSSHNNFKT